MLLAPGPEVRQAAASFAVACTAIFVATDYKTIGGGVTAITLLAYVVINWCLDIHDNWDKMQEEEAGAEIRAEGDRKRAELYKQHTDKQAAEAKKTKDSTKEFLGLLEKLETPPEIGGPLRNQLADIAAHPHYAKQWVGVAQMISGRNDEERFHSYQCHLKRLRAMMEKDPTPAEKHFFQLSHECNMPIYAAQLERIRNSPALLSEWREKARGIYAASTNRDCWDSILAYLDVIDCLTSDSDNEMIGKRIAAKERKAAE